MNYVKMMYKNFIKTNFIQRVQNHLDVGVPKLVRKSWTIKFI